MLSRLRNAMIRSHCLFLCVTVLLAAASGAAQGGAPDLILYNGKILTVNDNFAITQAVAVSGNQITAVGTNEEVRKLAGPNTQTIDLKGRTVIPGIIDTHRHINEEAESNYGGEVGGAVLQRYVVDWRGVKTKDDVLNQIKSIVEKYKFKPANGSSLATNSRLWAA